jgi:predicted AAA+ superfamily ATPase
VNITPAQVQNYLHHLCSAFIISGVQRYDVQGKRIFEFGEKYFFENTGIRNAIAGYRPQDLGKIMENIVCHHLLASGYSVQTGALGNREIDFVASKSGETTYIQVALNLLEPETLQREFGNLNDIQDHYPKKVITLESFSGNSWQGIVHTNLRSFLMES